MVTKRAALFSTSTAIVKGDAVFEIMGGFLKSDDLVRTAGWSAFGASSMLSVLNMSLVWTENSRGDRSDPFGTPAVERRSDDFSLPIFMWKRRSFACQADEAFGCRHVK